MGIEPTYPAWKAGALTDVLHLHMCRGLLGFYLKGELFICIFTIVVSFGNVGVNKKN